MRECDKAQRQLNDLLDGQLSASECVRLGDHLRACPGCRSEFDAIRRTTRMLRHLPAPVDGGAQERVMRRFRVAAAQERLPVSARRPPRLIPFGLGATAAGLACMLLLAAPVRTRRAVSGRRPEPVGMRRVEPLPSSAEMDRLTTLHADTSAAILGASDEVQQDAIADVSARTDDALARPVL